MIYNSFLLLLNIKNYFSYFFLGVIYIKFASDKALNSRAKVILYSLSFTPFAPSCFLTWK